MPDSESYSESSSSKAATTTTRYHGSSFLLSDDDDGGGGGGDSRNRPLVALVVLNSPIARGRTIRQEGQGRHRRRSVFDRLWDATSYRVCADGGANQLYDATVGDGVEPEPNDGRGGRTFVPDVIRGDLDSLRTIGPTAAAAAPREADLERLPGRRVLPRSSPNVAGTTASLSEEEVEVGRVVPVFGG